MRNEYKLKGDKLIGKLNFIDLKEFCLGSYGNGGIIVKNPRRTVVIKTWRTAAGSRFVHDVYACDGIETDKFSDVAKYLKAYGYDRGFAMVKFPHEIVEVDGAVVSRDDACLTFDTGEWLMKDDCHYCETDDEWYEHDCRLVYLNGRWYRDDDPDIFWCESCEEYYVGEGTPVNTSRRTTEVWCDGCLSDHAFECDDCGEWWSDDNRHFIDRPESTVCTPCYEYDYCYCEECNREVRYDYYDSNAEMCNDCVAVSSFVKPYHWHHKNSYINEGMMFLPKGRMISLGSSDETKTVGIELEVNKEDLDTDELEETIGMLDELAAHENEFYYEKDGSLDNGGFEIITGVHTFDSLKQMPWKRILGTLREQGYVSHDGGKCGLHVHIGRRFFGKCENAQCDAIGKIYAFYAMFWDDIVRASRRTNDSSGLRYCNHPYLEFDRTEKDATRIRGKITYKAKCKDGSHVLALNNSNGATFEFRLGRGTLVYESFMAWIDLTLVIATNSRRISIRRLGDIDRWLDGITRETAEYLRSRHAFEDSEIIRKLTGTATAEVA